MGSNRFALLALVAGAIFFLDLGGSCLWDEDEPRNAGCAAEMLSRGDWVVPYFNGEVRTHKPVLLYWLMMPAYGILGVNEFAARLPSALLGVLTVLLTCLIGCRIFTRRVGLLAGLVLASTIMFTVASRIATPDATLIFLVTASIAIYVAYTPRFQNQRVAASDGQPDELFPTDWRAVLAMYCVMGLATLAKGPIGFLLPTAVIGMFLLMARPVARESSQQDAATPVQWMLSRFNPVRFFKTVVFMRPGILMLGVLAVALPWYLLATVRSEGVWTRGFFLEHNLGRATTSMENHGGPPFFYILALMVGFFPWSIYFIPLVIDVVRSLKDEPARRDALVFAACWVGVIVGLFTLASTKLPSYVTPCYPGLALLMGYFVDRLISGEAKVARFWPYVSYSVLGVTGLAVAIALFFVAGDFLADVQSLALIGVVLIVGALMCGWFWRQNERLRMIQGMIATSVVFVVLLFSWGAHRIGEHQEIEQLTSMIHSRSDNPKIASMGLFRSSWVFYAGRPIEQLKTRNAHDAKSFLSGGPDHYLLMTDAQLDAWGGQLPAETVVFGSIPIFLESERLLLVGNANRTQVAERDNSIQR